MAEEDNFLDKTEQPTPRRIEEIAKKGLVVKSHDLIAAGLLLSVVLGSFFYLPFLNEKLQRLTVGIWQNFYLQFDNAETITGFTYLGLIELGKIFLVPLLVLFFIAILMNLIQTGFVFTFYPLKPHWNNVNFFDFKNYRKYFTLQNFVRTSLGQIKIAFIFCAFWIVIRAKSEDILNLPQFTPRQISIFLFDISCLLGFYLAVGYIFFGILDFAFQKWKYLQEIKMTTREVKEERRQSESNLRWKSKTQDLIYQLAINSVAATVPKSSFVIFGNQYAVALKYDPSWMLAPICIAVGTRNKASLIKITAAKNHVPIVENSSLAHSLFKEVKEGHAVPPAFYYEVAKIVSSYGGNRQ